MKAAAVLLVLAFGTMQGVSITDCPCGSLCETKNSCPSENHRADPSDDCCSRSGKPIENCFHLEPQTDLVVDLQEDARAPILTLLSDDPPTTGGTIIGSVVAVEPGRPPPGRSSPLFLLHSCLLL